MPRLPCRTADANNSIWHPIPEDTFRQHLVDLEKRTNAVPVDPQNFPYEETSAKHNHTLPLKAEQQFADDFAFLAAIEEGAQSVAAVCLEEHVEPSRLTLRFAALDLFLSGEVKEALQSICNGLSAGFAVEELFEQIVQLHSRRLIARLRSKKWEKPKYLARLHKKPLWENFANIIHRVQFLYLKKEKAPRRTVEAQLGLLSSLYEAFEMAESGSQDEDIALRNLIKGSYQFCLGQDVRKFAKRLADSVGTTPTAKVASAINCLRQVEKIGAYWRIADSLVKTSQQYPSLFKVPPGLVFLTPYESIPTSIGYESWATTCHVHAEVQLAVYYDLQAQSACASKEIRHPRAIGTSKWLCYLCYLFLQSHGGFAVASTHGRLYDQWTVPDLKEFGENMRCRYRKIVTAMDAEVVEQSHQVSPVELDSPLVRWRAEPMTSRQNLLDIATESGELISLTDNLFFREA